ncbi:MAG: acyltransferase [Acidobacteriota bacterium]|nr:acyltransferase [Acidobacteriota bacterium]
MAGTAAGFYRPELDVLRFLAFLLVFFFHGVHTASGPLDTFRIAGALGVCLFFLLSSYLITELLEREKRQSGAIHLKAFYIRRGLRIWPLYLTVLVFDYLLQRHLHPGTFTTSRLLAFLFAAGNWYDARYGFINTFSMVLWSIPVEEQFYILWPSARKYLHRSGAILFSLAMFAASYVALAYLCRTGARVSTAIWANSFVQFQFFSSGALLALTLRGRIPKLHPLLRLLLFFIGLGLLGAAQQFFQIKDEAAIGRFHLVAPAYLIANFGCILLLLSFLGEARLGNLRPLVYLGKISFGLYVFHWAMLRAAVHILPFLLRGHQIARTTANALELALAFVLTVLLASLSYRFFEAPILRYKKRFEFIRTRAV